MTVPASRRTRKLGNSIEGRLFIAAGVVLVVLVGLALLGERTPPIFGGDRALGRRAYLTCYVGAGGLMLSLALPLMTVELIRRLRAAFLSVDARGAVAQAILSDQALANAHTAGFGLMLLGLCASAIAATLTWLDLMWPAGR